MEETRIVARKSVPRRGLPRDGDLDERGDGGQESRDRTLYLDWPGGFLGPNAPAGNPGSPQELSVKFRGEGVKYPIREKSMDTEEVEGGSGRAKVDELLARGRASGSTPFPGR